MPDEIRLTGPRNGAGAPSVSLDVQLTQSDYKRAHRQHFWRMLWWLTVVAPLISMLPLWRAREFRSELLAGSLPAVMTAIGICLAVSLFLAFAIEVCARSFSSHAVRRTPLALERQTITLSANGMQTKSASSSGHISWSAVRKAEETSWSFQLLLGPGQYVLLPFHQLPSQEERIAVRDLLKLNLGARMKTRR